ncbi:glycosyltransferase family 2 protein, partial [Cetobacterium sp.]|uniref:glycosyltransferase family 2 protein n=1 Tax=Cetobacterium sp. TaxID=2071632 RepID=UPI003F3230A8
MEVMLSIIVPVYNVESYLEKCLDSILNQSFKNFEVIVVDDFSTDRSRDILEIYKKQDTRIKTVYCTENKGQSYARNKGLDLAIGKYIGFVDSDDSIHVDMYKDLVEEMEKNFDLAVCGREMVNEAKKTSELPLKNEVFYFEEKSKMSDYLCQEFIYPHTVVVYNKIYRNSIINKLNLRFQDLKVIGTEDTLFNYNYILNISSIKVIPKNYYIQFVREGSTMGRYNPGY